MTTETSKKVRLIHDPTSLYYIHPSESAGNSLTKHVLKGDNYDVWEKTIVNALEGRSRVGFLTPTGFPKPTDEQDLAAWKANNSIICSWICNNVDEHIQPSIISHKVAHELWLDLKTRYGGSNGPRIHQLKSELQSLRQKGQTVVVYYNQFVTIWNKLYGSVDPTCGCRCEPAALIRAREEQEKTHHFLLGLDDEQFGHIRSQLIATEPVPDIHRAYALIVQEERHKNIVHGRDDRTDAVAFAMQRPITSTGRGDPPLYSCTHCGKDGHSKDRCYQLHGYPPGKGRGRGGVSGRGGSSGRGVSRGSSGGTPAVRGAGTPTGGAHAVGGGPSMNSSPLGLTSDQFSRLLSMLDTSSTEKAAGGSTGESSSREWLIDSGASHHMTGWRVYDLDTHRFFHTRDISFDESQFSFALPTPPAESPQPVAPTDFPELPQPSPPVLPEQPSAIVPAVSHPHQTTDHSADDSGTSTPTDTAAVPSSRPQR
ncbi:unnamed protein product [Cuscuta campestris]|uniref:CCHC-type domain-containing protein n=1 Tax=Cuscuta campestris TaxID=132261 RepID=A0A484LT41_9ASTE|nr:unnamed protein product [Cuscuta campestris]